MVVPETFTLPPWYVLILLGVILIGVVAVLWALEPPITDETVVAFAPWMLFGSVLHVLYKIEAFPAPIDILFGAPTVYLTTAIVAGIAWMIAIFLYAAGLQSTIYRFVGITGTGFFVVFTTFAFVFSWELGTFTPFWPVLAVVIAGLVTALVWIGISLAITDVAAVTSLTGALVLFSHTLDGVSTAIGYDILGAREEVPASRFILETSEQLPTYELLGAGWLFVLVKVLLAVIVLWLFTDFVREEPRQARALLAVIAAVGLGPGAHNVLLFVIA